MTKSIFASFSVFILCCSLGLLLASRNTLDNDECYSQHQSIQGISFIDMAKGNIPEGNNCPLFYALQKSFHSLLNFKLNTMWVQEQNVCEDTPQIIMRILPVVFMSLAISLVFLYFYLRYNFLAALIALALFFSSPLIWQYWAQNRPYGLWILLSSLQTMLLCEHITKKGNPHLISTGLTIVHWLLALTTSFGLVQVLLAAFFIRKNFLMAFVLPAIVSIFFVIKAPHYPFRLPTHWVGLFLANIPPEKIIFISVSVFLLRPLWPLGAWLAGLIMLGLALVVHVYLQHTQGISGFEVSSRYFLFLLPTGIILFNVSWQELSKKYAKNLLEACALWQILLLALILGTYKTWVLLQRLI